MHHSLRKRTGEGKRYLRDTYGSCNSHTYGDTDTYVNTYVDAHTDSNADAYIDTYADFDAYAYDCAGRDSCKEQGTA
jgi:hypothetical protein